MRKKDFKIKDLRISIIDYLIWIFLIFILSYVISLIACSFIIGGGITSILYIITSKQVIVGTVIIALIAIWPFIYMFRLNYERNYVVRRIKGQYKAVNGNLENSHFITVSEMERDGYRIYHSLEELKTAQDGILLNFEEYSKNKIKAVFSPDTIHTLVLGTTGSGKTSAYIIPTIKVLGLTASKPSFIFTDPKGELLEKTGGFLKAQGYDVKVLDFRHPERSLKWNPLAYAYEKYQLSKSIIEEASYCEGKHYFLGKEYSDADIENAVAVEEQRLEDEAYEEILNVASAICPINPRDPIWDNGAKSFIQAVLIAMLEDSMDDDCDDMSIEKYNFYNVAKICAKTDNDCEELKNYFKFRKPTSLAVQYSAMVLNAPDRQMGSYMSSVAEKLIMFNDRGICNMTSGTPEIDIKAMDEKPTAVYLVLPDEKEGRHPLGSLFISQAYKKLVEKAVENNGTLKRKTYFIMDEYGNMPKIDGVQSMFTVGRSRGIIQMPVIQAYSQITEKYGSELAKTIFGNCNIEIFIGAKDDDTCEKFSKKLGNYTVLSANVTGQRKAFEHNISESLKERPLMYPRELTLLNNKNDMGNLVAVNQGYSPSIGRVTPYFKSRLNQTEKTIVSQPPRALDEESVLYRFDKRYKNAIETGKKIQLYKLNEQDFESIEKNKDLSRQVKTESPTQILERFSTIASSVGMAFADNYSENIVIINEIISKLRENREIIKLSQALKLKESYENSFKENDNEN